MNHKEVDRRSDDIGRLQFWEVKDLPYWAESSKPYHRIVAFVEPIDMEFSRVVSYDLLTNTIIEEPEQVDYSVVWAYDDQPKISQNRAFRLAPALEEHPWIQEQIAQRGFYQLRMRDYVLRDDATDWDDQEYYQDIFARENNMTIVRDFHDYVLFEYPRQEGESYRRFYVIFSDNKTSFSFSRMSNLPNDAIGDVLFSFPSLSMDTMFMAERFGKAILEMVSFLRGLNREERDTASALKNILTKKD